MILQMEAHASSMAVQAKEILKNAAMLRKELLAGGRSVTPLRGKKIDPEIAAMASSTYQKKRLRKELTK